MFLLNFIKWISVAQAGTTFAPVTASDIAVRWNSLFSWIVWVSTIACVMVIGGMVYFVLKYKRKTPNDKTAYITHNSTLEFLWSFIPLVIFLVVFAWGWSVYHDMRTFPEGAKEIHVYASKWRWEFEYKNGLKVSNDFVVPVNTPIKLIMTSREVLPTETAVIHSFFLPSFRIKQDVVPGRYTALWFNSQKLGDFHVFCTEFCGDGHSQMLATMHVVPQADYDKFISGEGTPVMSLGEKLYNEKTCVGCHSTDGSVKVGPSFKGIWGKKEALDDGTDVLVDENYVRLHISQPSAKTVKGFPKGTMPSFQGQLSEEELAALIDFIKSLK